MQQYINGYIASLNNLLSISRSRLLELRSDVSNGLLLVDEYKPRRAEILKVIRNIRQIKKNYRELVYKVNKLDVK